VTAVNDTRSCSRPKFLRDFNLFGSFFRLKWTIGPEISVTSINQTFTAGHDVLRNASEAQFTVARDA
jgi:hypothetical protein